MSSNTWWVTPNGTNLLSGLDVWNSETRQWDNDPSNPAKLHRYDIIDFLRRLPQARVSFDYLYPSMSDAEKLRLDVISKASVKMVTDPTTLSDNFQKRMNTQGIYTTGPKGGGN